MIPAKRLGAALLLMTAACAGRGSIAHEQLHSVLWTQQSPEFRALVRQTYLQAHDRLEEALADPSWTASLEQSELGSYQELPGAVILDVDETVLDNSPYQARLIRNGQSYNETSWNAWCREKNAQALPGAVEFTQYAAAKGVTVFYVTNRRQPVEEATRENLKKWSFALDSQRDTLLTRGEKEEWAMSDKTPRREAIAKEFRILLLLGDNFGDFLEAGQATPEERQALELKYKDYWGKRWIVFPNPQYGSWEGSLFGFNYTLSEDERLKRKHGKLRVN